MSLITIVPTAARSTDGSAGFGGWTPDLPIGVQLDVTAVSGTSPTLTVRLEQSYDGVTWYTPGSVYFNAVNAIGIYRFVDEVRQGATGLYRISWQLGGTSPSFTFSAIAHAKP